MFTEPVVCALMVCLMERARSMGRVLVAMLLPWHIMGCLSPQSSSPGPSYAAGREDVRILQENINRLEGNIEQLNMQLEQLSKDVSRERAGSNTGSESRLADLERQSRVLQDRIDELDRTRETDREEIIDTITSKVAGIIERQTAGRPQPRPSTSAMVAGGSQTGYEHTVQSGETLSAIAKAYNVSMKALIDANNLSDPNSLRTGQTLFVPE